MHPLAFVAVVLMAAGINPQDPPALRSVATIEVGIGVVTRVAMSPSGRLAALATLAGEVVCVHPGTRHVERRWRTPPGAVANLQFLDDGYVGVRMDPLENATVADKTWTRIAVADGRTEPCAEDVTVQAEDMAPWQKLFPDPGPLGPVAVSASADRKTAVCLQAFGRVEVYRDGVVSELVDDPWNCRLAFTPDARWVVAALSTRVLLTAVHGRSMRELPIDAAAVQQVASGSNGADFILVTSRDVLLWNAAPHRELRRFPLPGSATWRIFRATSSANLLALCGWHGTRSEVAVLDLDTGDWREYPGHHGSLSWTGDGQRLLVGSVESRNAYCIHREGGVSILGLPWEGLIRDLDFGARWSPMIRVDAVPGASWFLASVGRAACVDFDGKAQGPFVKLWPGPRQVWSAEWLLVAGHEGLQWYSLPTLAAGPLVPGTGRNFTSLVAHPARGCAVAASPGVLQVFTSARQ